MQAQVDPEAAARKRMQKQQRRARGRKRRLEELSRLRAVGLPVKHRAKREQRTRAD